MAPTQNALSFDVEDWFCVSNMKGSLPTNDWKNLELRLVEPTMRLLNLLERNDTKATFFILGWIADAVPDLIREISWQGHEIASHGYSHEKILDQSPITFARDVEKSLEALAKLVKEPVVGYRAPSFSITSKTTWAFDILEKMGFEYDSSVYPTSFHPDYGIGDSPLNAHKVRDKLWEIPLTCAEVFGRRIPCAGGGYFRLYPYLITKYFLKLCQARKRSIVFYLHPWELDPGQPRIDMSLTKKFRHYVNLDKTYERLEQLIKDFDFVRVEDLVPTAV